MRHRSTRPLRSHRVHINNETSHDVRAIRISAKQIVRARFGNSEDEKYKCQVALLETDRWCPVKKGQTYSQRFSVTPQLLPTESYHIAQRGRVSSGDTAQLAPSTRPEEGVTNHRCGIAMRTSGHGQGAGLTPRCGSALGQMRLVMLRLRGGIKQRREYLVLCQRPRGSLHEQGPHRQAAVHPLWQRAQERCVRRLHRLPTTR